MLALEQYMPKVVIEDAVDWLRSLSFTSIA